MPNRKISALPNAGPLDGSEFAALDQAGATVKATAQAIADLAGALWEIQSVGGENILLPNQTKVAAGDINAFEVEFEHVQGGDTHHTYLYVAPGIGGGGGDIQAETTIVGQLNVMDWFFWTRSREAGTFFDAIGDDGAGHKPECFLEVFADENGAYLELLSQLEDNHAFELDLNADEATGGGDFPGFAYANFFGDWIVFQNDNDGPSGSGAPLNVAPDAALLMRPGTWSLGFDGVDTITIKGNPTLGGGILATTLTLT